MPRKAKPIFSPPTPGEILKEFVLAERKNGKRITQEQLARAMEMSRLSVNELLNGKRAVTALTALKLGQVTGTGPEIWLNLQLGVDLFKARQELGNKIEKMPVLLSGPVPA